MGKIESDKNWTPNRPIRPAQPPAQSSMPVPMPPLAPAPRSTVMQVKVTKTQTTEELVELALPYYFEHDCSGDDYRAVYYGKVEATCTTKICVNRRRRSFRVEIEVMTCASEKMSDYLDEKYHSTEAAYLKAKATVAELLNGA